MESVTNKWIKWMEFGKHCGCHQMPERSFFIKGYQFPVCARCTGMFVGEIIAYIILFFKVIITPCIALILLFIMGIDWFIQFVQIKPSTNIRRFITGVMGGIGVTFCFLHLIINFFKFVKQKLM